jgi:predicted dehydrogenase
MTRTVRLAVLGAGLIGKRHIDHVTAEPEADLMAIVDSAPMAKTIAQEMGVRWAPALLT